MKKRNKLYVILLVILFSCTRDKQYSNFQNPHYTIPLPNDNDIFSWTDQIEEYFYLPLETQDAILQDIRHIEIYENLIFIADRRIVNCYGFSGKLNYSINMIGKGPGEYISIDALACQGEFIFIYDNNRRVNVYDIKTGQFRYDIEIDGYFYEMKSLKEKLVFYTSGGLNNINKDYEITIYDKTKKTYKRYFKNSPIVFQDGFESQLTGNENEIFYTNPLSNVVFKIDNIGEIHLHALIDLYHDGEIHNLKDSGKDFDTRRKLRQSNHYYGITQWTENKKYIYFHFKKNNEKISLLYSKELKKSYNLNNAKSQLPIFIIGSPIASYNEYFIRPVDSYFFSKVNKEKLNLKDSLTFKIYNQVKTIEPNQNPTLLFYKLKDE